MKQETNQSIQNGVCLMRQKRQYQKITWKLTQISLCSIFGSQHYSNGHFEDSMASTISIKCNEKHSYKV